MTKSTLILISILMVYSFGLFSQVPNAFNYQAILKNADGEIISGQEVSIKISILNENPTGDVVYSEEHTVTTNDIGMVSLNIGEGSLLTGDFSQIPWNEGDKFLKIEIDDSGGSSYAELGTFQLLSVPFALFASSASKLGNNVEYSTSPDTLFVVKDHEGNAVFVVYPDGAEVITNNNLKGRLGGFAVSGRTSTKGENSEYLVVTPDSTRIYVNEPLQKGRLGGFAVSGRTSTKGLVNDYLFVTGDSTRIYVNEDETKGRLGGFAVSGRTSTKGLFNDYLQVTRDSTRIYISESETKGRLGGFAVSGRTSTKEITNDYFNISGTKTAEQILNESRVMWYPQKAALLAGEIHVGGADSVGTNSMAMGYRSISMGNFSQAFGYKAQAMGDYATAIGDSAIANGLSSFALGDQSISNSKGSYSFGYNAQALGDGCFALGSVGVDTSGFYNDVLTIADGIHSFAIGQGAQTNSGIGNIALGSHAIAQGGVHSISIGSDGVYSADLYPMPVITQNIASGDMSMALGFGNKSNASSSMAIGIANTSNGYRSIAMGYNSVTEADYSMACGYKVQSQALGSFVIGRWNESTGDPENWVDIDPLFIIGNGYRLGPNIMRRNALTVLKNGNIGIGISTPVQKLDVAGNIAFSNYLYGAYGTIAQSTDEWLRINPANSHSSGTLIEGILRADNGIYVGDDEYFYRGGEDVISTTDNLHVSGEIRQAGSDYGAYEIQTPGQIYANDYIVAMGGIHIGGTSDPGTDDLYVDGCIGIGVAPISDKLYVYNGTTYGAYTTLGWQHSSDKRLKTNIEPVHSSLKKVMSLQAVYFNWKKDLKKRHIGLIAQDVEPILPEVVSINDNGYYSISYGNLSPLLIEAIKEQQNIIEKQKNKISDLEQRLLKLEQILQDR